MKTPQDEIDLAAAIAAAKSRYLKLCTGTMYMSYGESCMPAYADRCCALGALKLAGINIRRLAYKRVLHGNDYPWLDWSRGDSDAGETLGYAFRLAMQED